MFDAVCPSDVPLLQRARGELDVTLRRRGEATVLEDLRQSGCLKARFPRGAAAGWHGTVVLNSSGGVAAGDRLHLRIRVRAEARVSVAAQAAERFYRAPAGSAPAVVRNTLEVAEGAAAEWLPQETILFDGARLDRCLDVDLAAGSWFLGAESLIFGRAAMGETLRGGSLRDLIRLRRGGRLLLHDAVRMAGDIAALLARPALGGGAGAVATLVHVAPDAEARLPEMRAALEGAEAGASAWDGMLLVRALAPDGAKLRRIVTAALAVLRGARSLPRVWRC